MPVDSRPSPEECNCFAIRAAARHVTQFYDQVTINALAEDMVMDRTTLGRNILPLERDKLIRVEPAASDRRAKELHLTKAGERRLKAARKRWSVAQGQFEASFGAKRAVDLRASLRAVVASEMVPTTKSAAGKRRDHL